MTIYIRKSEALRIKLIFTALWVSVYTVAVKEAISGV